MGCASSKRIEATAVLDVYKPAPSSYARFDINSIEEPWLKTDDTDQTKVQTEDIDQVKHMPDKLLDKLNSIDDAPRSWDEVSKELEDLKPKLRNTVAVPALPAPDQNSKQDSPDGDNQKLPRKNFSFHTLEELESKKSNATVEKKKIDNGGKGLSTLGASKSFAESKLGPNIPTTGDVPKSLKENIFIIRDREERNKDGKNPSLVRYNPLNDFQEICPPNGSDSVVLYSTSIGGVRRTYEDCNRVKQLLEIHQVVYDERDVSLDSGFLTELRDLLAENNVSVPRVFVKGRYIGGVDEIVGLNERGVLSRILNWAKVERGLGRLGCGGCGGARFVPCLKCGGSCKVVVGENKERCDECNENGLVHCPLCA